jgi:uncharacterized protein YbjT (DUF2867 family)
MTNRLLITGASGNIGREIVKSLKDRHIDFVAASRQASYFTPEVRQLTFDYLSRPLLEEAFKGIGTLFLILPMDEMMVTYAENALMTAHKVGVQSVVVSSMLGADSESSYLLRQVHGQIDDIVRRMGISWTILRPNTFMQGFTTRHRESIQQGALFVPEGESKSSFVDVRDVAEVAVEVLLQPERFKSRIIEITGTEALSNEEALVQISRSLGRRIAYVPVTESATRHRLLREGEKPWLVEAFLSQHRAAREGGASLVSKSNVDIRGRAARTFEEFSREMVDFWEVPRFEGMREIDF